MDVIAVVTGASRGAGKGIAIALGETGATVYVTGRSSADGDSPYGGTVTETAGLITRTGGKGVAITLDHTDDDAVAALFARVKARSSLSSCSPYYCCLRTRLCCPMVATNKREPRGSSGHATMCFSLQY
jgi:NAD(P)-dependent dehydrogenase (short-subunit alcohol dehydrogenase family)